MVQLVLLTAALGLVDADSDKWASGKAVAQSEPKSTPPQLLEYSWLAESSAARSNSTSCSGACAVKGSAEVHSLILLSKVDCELGLESAGAGGELDPS